MDAGPDARKRRSLLINFDPESGALQQSGGGHAAKTRTDNSYGFRTSQNSLFGQRWLWHGAVPRGSK
jgi:hypothetical protein